MTGVLAGLIGTIGVDNTGPVIPTPTRTTSGSMSNATQTDTVSWGAITDAGSGVASATVYQTFTGSTSGVVAGTNTVLGSFGASSTTFAIPTNRRQGDTGQTWTVSYHIVATDSAGNSTTGAASTAVATLRYDNTGPVVPTPTRATTGSMNANDQVDTVSWGAITDAGSGVASAIVYQLYYGSTSGYVAGTSHPTSGSLSSFGAGSTTFAIPTNRREGDTGENWLVTYYIIATDNAGNSLQGTGSTAVATLRYDNTGPVVPTPTRATSGSMNANDQVDTVSWTVITDAGSGVASAIVYQTFTGSTSGVVAGATHPTTGSLSTFAAGNTTFAIPTNRRQGDGGQTWTVSYHIVATDSAGNSTTGAASTAVATLRYDITNPVVPTPTVVTNSGTQDTVSWGAITDAGSGVASATVYQLYYGSTSGFVGGTAHPTSGSLASFGAGSTTFAIPTNRRNTPTGETWLVTYYIIAIDAAGNSLQGTAATNHYTKPLGTYSYIPTTADARNIGNTAWLGQGASDEGVVGVSTTKFIGAWFYGSGAFTADNFTQWDPDSGTIFLKRASSVQTNRGNSGTFSIKMHGSGTKSGAITTLGTTLSQSLSGNNASAYLALDASQLANIGDGDGQGFALTAHSTGIGFLRGLTDYGGLVTLVYT